MFLKKKKPSLEEFLEEFSNVKKSVEFFSKELTEGFLEEFMEEFLGSEMEETLEKFL